MPAEVTERRITTAPRLVRHLLRSMMEGSRFYRGESDARWSLKPSAWRNNPGFVRHRNIVEGTINDWANFLPGDGNTKEDCARTYLGASDQAALSRMRDLVIQLVAERSLVRRLADECDAIALTVPGLDDLTAAGLSDYKLFSQERRARLVPVFKVIDADAFAQHHSIPTRLLDFSDHPLKAAFFAVEAVVLAGQPLLQIQRPDFAVWIVEPIEAGRPLIEQYMNGSDAQTLRVLRSKIAYLHAQDGLFVHCNAAGNAHFLDAGDWPSFELLLHGWRLEKVMCPADIAVDVLNILRRMGISRASLMPSYSEASIAVRDRWLTD